MSRANSTRPQEPPGNPSPGVRPDIRILAFSAIQRCPKRILKASHYKPSGQCKCNAQR